MALARYQPRCLLLTRVRAPLRWTDARRLSIRLQHHALHGVVTAWVTGRRLRGVVGEAPAKEGLCGRVYRR